MGTRRPISHATLREGYSGGILSLSAPLRNPKVCNGWLARPREVEDAVSPDVRDILQTELEATPGAYSEGRAARITAVT